MGAGLAEGGRRRGGAGPRGPGELHSLLAALREELRTPQSKPNQGLKLQGVRVSQSKSNRGKGHVSTRRVLGSQLDAAGTLGGQ